LDEWGARLADEFGEGTLVVSLDSDVGAHIYPKSVSYLPDGICAEIITPQGEVTIASQMVGLHNLSNLLVALGMLLSIGIDPQKAALALAKAVSPKGRLQRIRTTGSEPLVVVDYAHTPDALERVLIALRPMAPKRLICVFGCGGDRDRTKRAPMGTIASKRADICVVTSDNPRSEQAQFIISDILMGMPLAPRLSSRDLLTKAKGVWTEPDRKVAIRNSILAATPEDLVLIAGKGHETHQIIGKEKLHFDDSEVAEAALKDRKTKGATR
jgi:UDP-N-acetylmuramoyl-L-alanyl-D-glutamate--2,6-diaminopimelate ligase